MSVSGLTLTKTHLSLKSQASGAVKATLSICLATTARVGCPKLTFSLVCISHSQLQLQGQTPHCPHGLLQALLYEQFPYAVA